MLRIRSRRTVAAGSISQSPPLRVRNNETADSSISFTLHRQAASHSAARLTHAVTHSSDMEARH